MTEVTDAMLKAGTRAIDILSNANGGLYSVNYGVIAETAYHAMRALEGAAYAAKVSKDPRHKDYAVGLEGAVERRKVRARTICATVGKYFDYYGAAITDRRLSTSTAPEPPKRREQGEPHFHRRYGDEQTGPPTRYITHGHSRKTDG